MNRRRFLTTLAAALPLPAFYPRFAARAAPLRQKVKITDVKVMLVKGLVFTHPLIRVDTDAGISGIGEAYWGPGSKEIILNMLRRHLLGEDPLQIDRLYTKMVERSSGAGSLAGVTVTAISGVEIALWDLAGKILGAPVYELLGGKFRDSVRAYYTSGVIPPDKKGVEAFAKRITSHPWGFKAFKVDYFRNKDPREPLHHQLSRADLTANARSFLQLRELLGDAYEFAVHCHWEFDWPTALELGKAIAPSRPWWLEDPLPPAFSDAWVKLTAQSQVPILMGENLYTRQGFKPFITGSGCHMVQIDIPKSGGLLESKKIADLADVHYMPVCAHNVALPIGAIASAHAAASMRNFKAHESNAIGPDWPKFVNAPGPIVKDGTFQLFEKPGLGVELNEPFVRTRLAPGETWWG